ncbi:hypothetical protein U9M48_004379 [Paspalum notatum var. saurae]|uniref:PGG domain-containing protein n=1 Tax=Paspalum notatum var. saurae TaxID=547442 RepID=A0AAQ3PUN9_PASNO
MDGRLLKAAVTGDATLLKQLASEDPAVLLGTTPQGNTCLHIAAIHGHEEFCKETMALNGSLLDTTNVDGETPLLAAVTRGHATLACIALSYCRGRQLREMMMKQDKHGCNALHHAIRRGHRMLALELIEAEPALSKAVNERNESPMFIALMRGFTDVFEKLLEIPDSAHSGAFGFNVLHAAVRNGDSAMAKRILETRPELVRQENENRHTPMHLAVNEGKVDVLALILEHDTSLGYLIFTDGAPLLCIAASQGHVGVARELLKHCPDAPYCDANGSTCLHLAVLCGHKEFVEFVLRSQELQHLINMADNSGKTAVHLAATNCRTDMVDAFLLQQGIDVAVLDNGGNHAKALITVADAASTSSSEGPSEETSTDSSGESEDESTDSSEASEESAEAESPGAPMDKRLLSAAVTGDATVMMQLASDDPAVLLGTTPHGNTCLHISAIYGHEEFCKHAVSLNRCCRDQQLSETILKQDKWGCNALHRAISGTHRMMALELIEAEPALSKAVNKCTESPMFIAVMSNYADIVDKLLEISCSAHCGNYGFNALHVAVMSGNTDNAKRIMEKRPELAWQENENKHTPMHLATKGNKVDLLTVLLQHDPSLGYLISTYGTPVLCTASSEGHVGVARELLKYCPDAPYCGAEGSTCLHVAISSGKSGFVKFALESQELRHLINVADNEGRTPLQLALSTISAQEVDDDDEKQAIVAALRSHLNLGLRSHPLEMDQRLLEAATLGHAAEMRHLTLHVPRVLLGTTAHGDTCLHIASTHGHERFCEDAQNLDPSLLSAINSDGETPLLAAVACGRVSVACVMLRWCRERKLSEAILKQDKHRCNALHHAIRRGHKDLALELIMAEPALSHAVNQYNESPMFLAVMRGYADVFEKLLEIPGSAHGGAYGFNALHAAVRNGNSAIARRIMETRPQLAREENDSKRTPMQAAVLWGKIDLLRVLLEHDRSLGYVVSTDGYPLLNSAAFRGHIDVAQEILKYCPNAANCRPNAWTCLHQAVWEEHTEFVEFVLRSPQLARLVNMRDSTGDTPLHLAVTKCNPKMVAALLLHRHTDVTVLNIKGDPASWELPKDHAKTLNWNEVIMLMLKADPQDETSILNLYKEVKDKVTQSSRKDIKSLTQTYTGNTSLVAILIATITFAAAFTLPGGYNSDTGNEGLPIMARKFAFQAFLISDTLAMCSSLVVAFVCIIARWEDLEFLLYYRSFTKKLMWFAYMATTTAFATGLYTVLAPRVLWLAIVICIVTSLLPILTKLLGEWPILKLRFRLGRTFKHEILDMV